MYLFSIITKENILVGGESGVMANEHGVSLWSYDIIIYKKCVFDHSDDQNIILRYMWSSSSF